MTPTRAERLRALETRYQATTTREVRPDQTVVVGLQLESGDRIVGRGPTTEDAITHLEGRVAMMLEG